MAKKKATPEKQESNNSKKTTIDIMDKTMTIIENAQKTKIPLNNKQIAEILYSKKINLRCKNTKQKDLVKSIDTHEIIIAVGPAGTGKSFISIYKALEMLANPNTNFHKIYIVTPNVEIDGSELGFLPGDVASKLSVYLFSTYYLMDKIIGKENRKKLVDLGIIEPLAIGYLRGCNIDSSILIGEEMQNTTSLQFKTLITRIGFNSCFLLSGDLEQVDIKNYTNGLSDAINKFSDMPEIGIVKFEKEDIVRNPLIGKILSKY